MIGWKFPLNNDGLTDGSGDGAIDTFAGARLSSMVREIIQNSLDAKRDKPVQVSFSLSYVRKDEFNGFSDIKKHLEGSRDVVKEQGHDDDVKYYENGIRRIKELKEVPVLCVHDFNTFGLTGLTKGVTGSWIALVKGKGMSQKISSGALGSFGHGSKAPFVFSDIRTIFYYTKIKNDDGKFETRFQGKSILLSHHDSNGDLTQGTGFYGHEERLQPLINNDVPKWATALRNEINDDTGTSIFIPYTSFTEDLFPETKITVVANFFYAIKKGELEVAIDGKKIDSTNIESTFRECQDLLSENQEAINIPHIEGCFESISTIVDSDHEGTLDFTEFGEIEWYIRVGDVSRKKVGIARSSGMLITRDASGLLQFGGMKPFDLFVCVRGRDGSNFLKDIENPAHNNFEIDRIKLEDERKKVQKIYDTFTRKIREIIKEYASIDISEEEILPDLDFLFPNPDENESDSNKQAERSKNLILKDGPMHKDRNVPPGGSDDDDGGDRTKKKRRKHKRKRKNDDTDDNDRGGRKTSDTKYSVENFRVRYSDKNTKEASLYFDSPVSGKYKLKVFVSGESGNEELKIKCGEKFEYGKEIEVVEEDRNKCNLEFEKNISDFAIEGLLHKIEEAS